MKTKFELENHKTLNTVTKILFKCKTVEAYTDKKEFPYTMYKIDGDILEGRSPSGVSTRYTIIRQYEDIKK